MADPLSLAASVIAVVGVAKGVALTMSKIKNIHNAPAEVLALSNEVSDLQILLDDVQKHIVRNPYLSQERLQYLSTLVGKAKDKLLQLDELIQYRLLRPGSSANEIRVLLN